jgi:hypothetical protein
MSSKFSNYMAWVLMSQPPPAHRKTENKHAQGWLVLRIYRLQECLQHGQQGSAIHCTTQQEDTDSRRSTVYGEATNNYLYFKVGTDQQYHFRNGVHQGLLIMNCSLTYTWKTLWGRYAWVALTEICGTSSTLMTSCW